MAWRAVLQISVSLLATLAAMIVCHQTGLGIGFTVVGSYFAFALVLTAFYEANRRRFPDSGLLPAFGAKGASRKIATLTAILVAVLLVSIIVTGLPSSPQLRSDLHWRLGVPLVLTLSIALFEEVLFRGYLFCLMRSRCGLGISLLTNGMLFGLLHFASGFSWPESAKFTWLGFAYYFVTAAVLCLVAAKTMSLITGIVYHVVFNFTVGVPNFNLDSLLAHNGVFVFSTPHADALFMAWMTGLFVLLTSILWALGAGSLLRSIRTALLKDKSQCRPLATPVPIPKTPMAPPKQSQSTS